MLSSVSFTIYKEESSFQLLASSKDNVICIHSFKPIHRKVTLSGSQLNMKILSLKTPRSAESKMSSLFNISALTGALLIFQDNVSCHLFILAYVEVADSYLRPDLNTFLQCTLNNLFTQHHFFSFCVCIHVDTHTVKKFNNKLCQASTAHVTMCIQNAHQRPKTPNIFQKSIERVLQWYGQWRLSHPVVHPLQPGNRDGL